MPGKAKSPRVRVGERGGLYTVDKNGVRRYVKRSQKGGVGEPPTPMRAEQSYTQTPSYTGGPMSASTPGGGQTGLPLLQINEWGDPGQSSATGPGLVEGGDNYDPNSLHRSPNAWQSEAPGSTTAQAPTPGRGLIFGGKVRRKPDTVHRGGAPKAKPKRKPSAKKTRRAKCK